MRFEQKCDEACAHKSAERRHQRMSQGQVFQRIVNRTKNRRFDYNPHLERKHAHAAKSNNRSSRSYAAFPFSPAVEMQRLGAHYKSDNYTT